MSDPVAVNPHLRPTAPISVDALLPGDPGRALALAQALLEQPKMCNHHRGLWGYSGVTADGRELTIQSTGIGGSSAAIVLAELARHGVRRAIRIGTCTALEGGPPLGAAIAAEGALGAEGASRALGADGTLSPDPELHSRLVGGSPGAPEAALVASVDLVSAAPGLERAAAGPGDGVAALEMGTATLFALGPRIGVAVASALVVTATRGGAGALEDAELERASTELAGVAARALAP